LKSVDKTDRPVKPRVRLVDEDRIIFFLTIELKHKFKVMCEQKTELKKGNGCVTMSRELRRLVEKELNRYYNPPF
jgi:hypothetical protein